MHHRKPQKNNTFLMKDSDSLCDTKFASNCSHSIIIQALSSLCLPSFMVLNLHVYAVSALLKGSITSEHELFSCNAS